MNNDERPKNVDRYEETHHKPSQKAIRIKMPPIRKAYWIAKNLNQHTQNIK